MFSKRYKNNFILLSKMISVSESEIAECRKNVNECLEITQKIINDSLAMIETTKEERKICAEYLMRQTEQSHPEGHAIDSNKNSMDNKIVLYRLLYNNCSSDYTFDDEFFSDLFVKTYREKYGTEHCGTEHYFMERDNNPKIMEIYDLLGQEKSSKREENGRLLSSLKVMYFPIELQKYIKITTFDGRERVDVDHAKLYREFYERVVINNEPVEEIKKYYQRLRYVSEQYYKGKYDKFKDENIFIME